MSELEKQIDASRRAIGDHFAWRHAQGPSSEWNAVIGDELKAVANAARLALLASLLTHEQVAYGIPVVTSGVLRAYQEQYSHPKEPTSG